MDFAIVSHDYLNPITLAAQAVKIASLSFTSVVPSLSVAHSVGMHHEFP